MRFAVSDLHYTSPTIFVYYTFDKIQLNKAMNQLREWIPKYRYVLLEKKEKALLEGNSSTVEYCETDLYRLKDIENEVLNWP